MFTVAPSPANPHNVAGFTCLELEISLKCDRLWVGIEQVNTTPRFVKYGKNL